MKFRTLARKHRRVPRRENVLYDLLFLAFSACKEKHPKNKDFFPGEPQKSLKKKGKTLNEAWQMRKLGMKHGR